MYLQAITNFKHGRTAFEKGVVYDVPEALGGYLMGVGWGKPLEALPDGVKAVAPALADLLPNAPAERKGTDTLEVQDVDIGVMSPKV
jgi:hypothetical protein